MKFHVKYLVLILCLPFINGCDNSILPPDNEIFELEPLPGAAVDIELEIRSATNDLVLDKWDIPSEGEMPIILESNHDNYVDLCVHASAEGYYSKIYNCVDGQTITVDLDAHMEYNNSLAGTLTGWQQYPDLTINHPAKVLPNAMMVFCFSDGSDVYTTTDGQGRFGLGNLPPGNITVHFDNDFTKQLYLAEGDTTYYQDIFVGYTVIIYAPNIYLYPEEETDVSVELDFPNGGDVVTSEPEYNSGWYVHATPEGRIDDQYDYLFYESALPDLFSADSGWIFSRDNLEEDFRSLLTDYGFNENEIDDFIEFWIPVLTDASYYVFYPQDVEYITTLDVSPQPESVLRVYWLMKPLNEPIDIPQPSTPTVFDRNGFSVVEWGVIGAPGLTEH